MSQLINLFTLIFVVSSLLILLLRKGYQPVLPAYIVAGMILSRYLPESSILEFSQLGIAFLVFIFGVKTDLNRISRIWEESLSSTLIQLAVAGISMYIIGRGMGFSQLNSLYLSAAASLSSSMIGLELIESEVRIDLLHGRLAEAMQLIQDLFAVFLLALLSSEMTATSISVSLLQAGGLLGLAFLVRKFLFGKIAEAAEGSRELLMLISLSALGFFISITHQLDLSLAVGAFAAGLSVAKFPHNMEILDTMGSLKDFFSVIFFVGLGALITVPGTAAVVLSLVIIVGTLILKPVITGISLMISGYDRRTSYLAGLSLDQVSEFSLIIAIQAYIAQTIATPVFQAIIISATVTMIFSTYTSRYEEEIYQLFSRYGFVEVNRRKINERSDLPENLSGHVILIGYDTQGKEIASGLEEEGQEFVVVENDPEKIIEASKNEDNYLFGDVMEPGTWERLDPEEARAIVSTVPVKKVSEKILEAGKDTEKILRASEVGEARDLLENGATYVGLPDILSSEELIDHVKGVLEDVNYREELRRRNLLEVRENLGPEEELEVEEE